MPVLPTFLHCSCSGASPASAPITLPAENRVRNIGPSPDAHHFFCISAACAIYERSTLSNSSQPRYSQLRQRQPPAQQVQRPSLELPRYTIAARRSEEHTSELQSLTRIMYAVFCMNKNKYI